MTNDNLSEKISAFLAEELSPKEMQAFRSEMANDPSLAEEVELQQMENEAMDELHKQSIIGRIPQWLETMDVLPPPPLALEFPRSKPRFFLARIWYLAICLLLLLLASGVYFYIIKINPTMKTDRPDSNLASVTFPVERSQEDSVLYLGNNSVNRKSPSSVKQPFSPLGANPDIASPLPSGDATNKAIPIPPMVAIIGGTFKMGSDDTDKDAEDAEKPAHFVTLSDFEIGKTEVTVAQYKAFIEATNYRTAADQEGWSYIWTGTTYEKMNAVNWRCDAFGKVRPEKELTHPVIHVSWNDAVAYCEWLCQKKPGKKFRLPTESEWEYAARGVQQKSKDFKYAGGDDINEVAWYEENTNMTGTRPVATKKPNRFGLFDMTGNVWEWCADWLGDYKSTENPILNPKGPVKGSKRVNRGGSWSGSARYNRVLFRDGLGPGARYNYLGFRIASSW